MIILYICIECGHLFEEQKHYVETHGLDTPPYEEWNGCPDCGGAYAETHMCDCCGEWITDDYIIANDCRYCQDCYRPVTLGDE